MKLFYGVDEYRKKEDAVGKLVSNPSMKLARLKWDIYNPKFSRKWRIRGGKKNCPQTITFNDEPKEIKDDRVKISPYMQSYMQRPDVQPDPRGWNLLMDPATGWLNKVTSPLTCEPVGFSGNAVIVAEQYGKFSRIKALSGQPTDTYFTPNGAFLFHKCTAGYFTKVGSAVDAYIPLLLNDFWVTTEQLEFFPAATEKSPHVLKDGRKLVRYELRGSNVFAYSETGDLVQLYKQGIYLTSWKMESPPPPE